MSELSQAAFSLLARREHSTFELKQKLARREFANDDIDELIVKLHDKDLLSDERFAESVIRSRANRGYGWLYIQNELKQKQVDSYIYNRVKDELAINWFDVALLAYQKKFSNPDIADHKDKAKRIRFLQYRGFSFEQISAALSDD